MTVLKFKAPIAAHMPITGELALRHGPNGETAMNVFDGNDWIEISGVETEMTQFEVLSKADVDGELWYTVKCTKEVGDWVRAQPEEQWVNHIGRGWLFHVNNFDIHYELYALMRLSWA